MCKYYPSAVKEKLHAPLIYLHFFYIHKVNYYVRMTRCALYVYVYIPQNEYSLLLKVYSVLGDFRYIIPKVQRNEKNNLSLCVMPEPVFFLEHHIAFKIVYVFDELPFRHNLQ